MVLRACRAAAVLLSALSYLASAYYTPGPLSSSTHHSRLTPLQPSLKHHAARWRHLPGSSPSGVHQLGALVSKDGWAERPHGSGSKRVMVSNLVRGWSSWWGRQSQRSRNLVARKASDATGIDGTDDGKPNVKGIALCFVAEAGIGLLALACGKLLKMDVLKTVVWADPARSLALSGILLLPLLVTHWLAGSAIDKIVNESVIRLYGRKTGWLTATGIAFLLGGIAGLCEELLFRGCLQEAVIGPLGPIWGITLPSLLFGLAHSATPRYTVLAFLVSLYLGFIQFKWQNLLIPIIVHSLFDVIGFMIAFVMAKKETEVAPSPSS